MSIVFNEDIRVKIPATIQFLRIGYDYQSLRADDVDIDFNTKIFVNRLKMALEKINHRSFTYDEIKALLTEIHAVIKNNDLGKSFYNWLVNPGEKVKLIDFDEPGMNDFAVVDELPFGVKPGTEEGSFRPDITALINGMPIAFLEVKPPDNEGGIQAEFTRMINKRLKNADYRKHFNMLQVVSFSNNMEYEEGDDAENVKAGSFYTTPNGNNTSFSFFREDSATYHPTYDYKTISDATIKKIMKDCGYNPKEADTPEFQENLQLTTPCNRFITSLFDKERFLYFIRYGMMFVDGKVPQKHIMRYPQFFATRRIMDRLKSGGKGGIIWHTQGSGKTGLSAFSMPVIRDYYSQQSINAKFYFIVDRLDLLKQATLEFKNRGFHVTNCNSKEEFAQELDRPLAKTSADCIGEVCVVNIQKFDSDYPRVKNDYNVPVQRVFFIDEAHRSYNSKGEFFKNLMVCDRDAVYIALTGTPLLSKKERSNLKFGEYVHKYFYDKSIADGYTLRIKKEHINTVAKSEIRRNLDVEEARLNDKDVFESDAYVACLCTFIERDFNNFRLLNSDKTIGGMIVCRTNAQAKKVHEWFKTHSKLRSGLVISDPENPMQKSINENNQLDFREVDSALDILVVNMMLTTGYDVKRLKKMYLLRGPQAHSLLQTISRVNRPYKSPNGHVYKYGYIVDFIDIEAEYDRTIKAYLKELEAEVNENGENEGTLDGLIVDKDDINAKYHKYLASLTGIIDPNYNLEKFSSTLKAFSKDKVLEIKRLLNGIKECHIEFMLSGADEYAAQIDDDRTQKLLATTQKRIDFLNLKGNTVDMMDVISNDEIVEILYEFIKSKISIIELGKLMNKSEKFKRFSRTVQDVQNEIKKNKNKNDIRIRKLDELLQEIFNKLDISDLSDLDSITDALLKALDEAREINSENDRLALVYEGNFAFVKTYKDVIEHHPELSEKEWEELLLIIHVDVKDIADSDSLSVQGQKNFVDSVKKNVTKHLLKSGLYKKIKAIYDDVLRDIYTNLQLFR